MIPAALQIKSGDSPSLQQLSLDSKYGCDGEETVFASDAEALLGLLQAIEVKMEMINRMAHLTPGRTYRSAMASGGGD